MRFCTKCGNELKDGDIYCGNCGTKVNKDQVIDDSNRDSNYYSNDYIENRTSGAPCKLCKVSLVFGIISLVIFFIVIGIAVAYDNKETPNAVRGAFDLLLSLGIITSGGALGLGISGFAVTKKKNGKMPLAIAAFVLGIVSAVLILGYYMYIS